MRCNGGAADYKTMKAMAALACPYVGCLAVLHNSDRDVPSARTFKRALLI